MESVSSPGKASCSSREGKTGGRAAALKLTVGPTARLSLKQAAPRSEKPRGVPHLVYNSRPFHLVVYAEGVRAHQGARE